MRRLSTQAELGATDEARRWLRAAARLPGVTPATGVALVTWFSRIGFVISPLAVGLIALYTSRSAVVEQRLAANEIRAKQALAAADGPVGHA